MIYIYSGANVNIGVKTVLGDLDNSELIQKQAAQSDIVFHTATADHLASAQAILKGIEERASQGMERMCSS